MCDVTALTLMIPDVRKRSSSFPTDTKQAVMSQELARGLMFHITKLRSKGFVLPMQ